MTFRYKALSHFPVSRARMGCILSKFFKRIRKSRIPLIHGIFCYTDIKYTKIKVMPIEKVFTKFCVYYLRVSVTDVLQSFFFFFSVIQNHNSYIINNCLRQCIE